MIWDTDIIRIFHIRLFKQVKVLKEKGYQLKAIKTALAKSLQDGKVIIPSEVLEEGCNCRIERNRYRRAGHERAERE